MEPNRNRKSAKRCIYELMKNLNSPDPEIRKAVWNVVAALRGPDDDNTTIKGDTTSRIRGALVTWSNLGLDGPDYTRFNVDDQLGISQPYEHDGAQEHFRKHVDRAVAALETLGITRNGKIRRYKWADQKKGA